MAMGEFKRADRVGQMLQKELAELLINGVMDPRVGFVTVTEVRVTDDLKTARVYVSIFGDEAKRTESLAGLGEAAGFLKKQLSRRVALRYIPKIVFCSDTTLDQAERLDRLIAGQSGEDLHKQSNATTCVDAQTQRSGRSELIRNRPQASPAKPKKRRNKRKGTLQK